MQCDATIYLGCCARQDCCVRVDEDGLCFVRLLQPAPCNLPAAVHRPSQGGFLSPYWGEASSFGHAFAMHQASATGGRCGRGWVGAGGKHRLVCPCATIHTITFATLQPSPLASPTLSSSCPRWPFSFPSRSHGDQSSEDHDPADQPDLQVLAIKATHPNMAIRSGAGMTGLPAALPLHALPRSTAHGMICMWPCGRHHAGQLLGGMLPQSRAERLENGGAHHWVRRVHELGAG